MARVPCVTMKFELPHTVYAAIDRIRGRPPDAHSLIMCARPSLKGPWTLDGPADAFRELADLLIEELEENLCPRADAPHLRSALDAVFELLGEPLIDF